MADYNLILSGFQPLDSDLTAIAALSPANDDFIQRKSGAWTNRTVEQVKSDIGFYTVVQLNCMQFTPSDSTIRYFGAHLIPPQATGGRCRMPVPLNQTKLKIFQISAFHANNAGTAELTSIYVRFDNATNMLVTNSYSHTDQSNIVTYTPDFDIDGFGFTFFEVQFDFPAFATNPAGTYYTINTMWQ